MIAEGDLPSLLSLAKEAADAGAAILAREARHVTGRPIAYARKGSPIDLVTEIDHASERAILAVLSRAGIPIVAEEGGGHATSGAVFYVDPLDGTTNYTHGHPFASVSIGLVVEGRPRLGVVAAPLLGVTWSAIVQADARGARRDLVCAVEHPLSVSEVEALDAALLATGFPVDRRTSDDDNTAAFAALTKRTHGVLRCGSAALDLALVADGTYDGYWERKLKPWDLAAGAALVLAAGGRVTDPWAGALDVTTGAIVASNGRIHDALLAEIAPHQPGAAR
jgi:myo-inositol-1(or 4)-monophosphatase